MDCGATFVKYVLFIFNILFVVCGILLIVFGSLMISSLGDFNNFADAVHTSSIPIAVIVLGCIIFLISFVGCCGAIRENTCMTMTYSVVMLILLILQLVLVIYVWVEQKNFLSAMNTVVDDAWTQRSNEGHFMDVLQLGFNCCGKSGATDYTLALEAVPNSCCGKSATNCSVVLAVKKQGCATAFVNFWEKNTNITRYAGLGVAAVELVAFIFGCCLANQIRNGRRRAAY